MKEKKNKKVIIQIDALNANHDTMKVDTFELKSCFICLPKRTA